MSYTVKKLSQLSGVSVRTLHFYDEIGLLKPAYYGDNNYRYYETEQLLMLQQILFYRELGFPLNEIQSIISAADFDKLNTLKSHKKILQQKLDQTHKLIETINKTINHLRGKYKMSNEELFYGFDSEKQKSYEKYLLASNRISEEELKKSKQKTKHWKKQDWEKYKSEGDALHKELAVAINQGLDPASTEVQALIKRHYQMIKIFWTPTKETYIGLAQLYSEHPDFQKFYAAYHPKLLDFLVGAMKIFAEQEL